MRDICDVAFVLILRDQDRALLPYLMAAAMHGGEPVDAREQVAEWLDAPLTDDARSDPLRAALGV